MKFIALRKGGDQTPALLAGCGGQDRHLQIDAAGPLQIHFDQVRTRGAQHPHDIAPVVGIGHLLRDHGIQSSRQTTVGDTRVTTPKRLVGLVNEHDAAAQGMDQAKDLLEVRFAGADPFVAEVLQFQYRDTGFAGQALDQEGLAGAHRSTQQVAHGQRLDVIDLPQCDVLAQPVLQDILTEVVIQGARRLHELDQTWRIALDHFLLQRGEVM